MDGYITFDEYRQMRRFGALDGMRAIGVILVIFEHFGGANFKWLSGWLGVHIFFVMSGFLITTLLLREQEKKGQVSLRNFFIRRVFRIFPVYYLVLAITIVQYYAWGGESWEQLKYAIPYYATFLNEQQFEAPWKLTWTMGIEWKFYMVWPVAAFFFVLGARRIAFVTFATVLLLAIFWNSSVVYAPHYVVLMLGAIVAILLHYRKTFDMLRYLMTPLASFLLFTIVVMTQVYVIHIPFIAGAYSGGRSIVIFGISVALFLPSLMGNNPINKALRSLPFSFVGNRSYSLYLIQILAWQALIGMNPTTTYSGMSVILTSVIGLVFADFLYRWVEQPMILVGKGLIQKAKGD